jgi:hypothetical protein
MQKHRRLHKHRRMQKHRRLHKRMAHLIAIPHRSSARTLLPQMPSSRLHSIKVPMPQQASAQAPLVCARTTDHNRLVSHPADSGSDAIRHK